MTKEKPHSADYFGEWRDFWWNKDFLELMARRCDFARVRSVLDVGCGVGHWTRTLAQVLPAQARLAAVDREDRWVAEAAQQAQAAGLGDRFLCRKASADQLPFPDSSFDLATCQTLLMHVPDPKQVMREMLRVLTPNGLLLIAEPNNLAGSGILSSIRADEPVQDAVGRFQFELLCERGKRALGLGNNSLGDLVPGLLAELGAVEIKTHMNDRATAFFPPYASQEQRALIERQLAWYRDEIGMGDRDESLKYFMAGGGLQEDFEKHWERFRREGRAFAAGVQSCTYNAANGHVMYLICARKKAV